MNRLTILHETPELTLGRFDHPPQVVHHDPPRERASRFAFNLLDRGVFQLSMRKQELTLLKGDSFVTYPGLTYRCRHQESHPDDICLSVFLKSSALAPELYRSRKAVAEIGILRRAHPADIMSLRQIARANRLTLGMEAVLLNLIAAVFLRSPEASTGFHANIQKAADYMRCYFAEDLSLSKLAGIARLSPFHFAHRFRVTIGTSPHRYLIRLRLLHSARALSAGGTVTQAAVESGFSHLGHFSRTFRAAFGSLPSDFRRLNTQDRKKVIVGSWLARADSC